MTSKPNEKSCIACAEAIKTAAVLCNYCGTRQDDPDFQIHQSQSETRRSQKPMQSGIEVSDVSKNGKVSINESVDARVQTSFENSGTEPPGSPNKKSSQRTLLFAAAAFLVISVGLVANPNLARDLGGWGQSPSLESSNTRNSAQSTDFEKAKERATSYLDGQTFSRAGLIGQLEYEGFWKGTAVQAVDALRIDWLEQAVRAAKEWMTTEHHDGTRQDIIDILIYAKEFTQTEAEHAAAAVGYGKASSEQSSADEGASNAQTPKQLMNDSLTRLNSNSSNGKWTKSQINDLSGLSIGMFLDDYGGGGGCGLWWYETEQNANRALDEGWINLFSNFYGTWVFENGATIVLVAENSSHPCYQDSVRILNLEQ